MTEAGAGNLWLAALALYVARDSHETDQVTYFAIFEALMSFGRIWLRANPTK